MPNALCHDMLTNDEYYGLHSTNYVTLKCKRCTYTIGLQYCIQSGYVARLCASALMIVSCKPLSSKLHFFVCLCFIFSPNVLNFSQSSLAYQNQNLFVGVKKQVQPIETKFVVAKIAYFRMLRILKK